MFALEISQMLCSGRNGNSTGHKKFLSEKALAMLQVVTRLMASEGSSAWMLRPEGRSAVRPPQEFDLRKKKRVVFWKAYVKETCC